MKAEIFTSTIVAVGDFNPAIFSPDWLEHHSLIGEGDAITAREGSRGNPLLVSHNATSFETDWFALQVLENQLSLASRGVLSPAFKDLATGIFQLVSHTPIIAVGMNFVGHFKLASVEDYHKVGDALVPKDIWSNLYEDTTTAGMEQVTLRFQKGSRDKPVDTHDEKRITVQPSRGIKFGISLALNDHHDVSHNHEEQSPAELVASIIDNHWESEWTDANRVFEYILSEAVK